MAFVILPLFALANTCITLGNDLGNGLLHSISVGIILGLVIGKPLGIVVFAFIGVAMGWCTLPAELKWKNIIGVGFLGGIGFTMSIFITLLAFDTAEPVNDSKIAIIVASIVAGSIGFIMLKQNLKNKNSLS